MKRNTITILTVIAGLLVTSAFAVDGHHPKPQADEAAALKLQTKCPVMGGAINPDLYADVNGKRIYVCCKGCIPAIEKDPAKYIKELEAKGVVLETPPKAEK